MSHRFLTVNGSIFLNIDEIVVTKKLYSSLINLQCARIPQKVIYMNAKETSARQKINIFLNSDMSTWDTSTGFISSRYATILNQYNCFISYIAH